MKRIGFLQTCERKKEMKEREKESVRGLATLEACAEAPAT
jgi:hypothetical protein